MKFFAKEGLPVYPTIAPNAGMTSPKSTAGTIAQGKMCREYTPLIYATLGTVADMRTGAYASGGIECERLHMAYARMAHCCNVPFGGYIVLTNSKLSDAQLATRLACLVLRACWLARICSTSVA